jgi:hypothetical protein
VKALITSRISSFYVGGPSPSAYSGGALSGMGSMVSQLFPARGNWLYPEFWALTGNPLYPGY